MNPILSFDFVDHDGRKKPFTFENPRQVIIAKTIEEVLPSLQKIQDALNTGYYAAGYISYEAAPAFDQSFLVNSNQKMPLLWFGIFDQPINKSLQSTDSFYTSKWIPRTSINAYNHNIDKVKQHIEHGDTYQVNYTIRMNSDFKGDSIAYYKQLAKAQSADYSAYLNIGDHTILSVSPELFFHLKEGKLTTKPMKGTIGRGQTADEDQKNADWLYHSEKNRAENVMIVDLLRNDLGIIANPGTVKVPKLFSIEEYPTVYQMTSTVTAEISPDKTISDIFKALFPFGSITGAPKISTMGIISDLESSPREVYCGAVGFITPEQEAIFNVPIRTVMIDNKSGNASYGVGGAVTWDSTDKEEYEEVLTKAKVLDVNPEDFQLLETLGLQNGVYLVLENHLKRIKRSADFFQFSTDLELIEKKLLDFAKKHDSKHWKVRLLVTKNGSITLEASEINQARDSVYVKIADEPIDTNDIFLYHKTTNRIVYEEMLKQKSDAFDVLLWNDKKEVTEFTMGNIVVEMDGNLYTPPIECGLLAGTYREALLEDSTITEKTILLDELTDCSGIWLINSVRQWVPVQVN